MSGSVATTHGLDPEEALERVNEALEVSPAQSSARWPSGPLPGRRRSLFACRGRARTMRYARSPPRSICETRPERAVRGDRGDQHRGRLRRSRGIGGAPRTDRDGAGGESGGPAQTARAGRGARRRDDLEAGSPRVRVRSSRNDDQRVSPSRSRPGWRARRPRLERPRAGGSRIPAVGRDVGWRGCPLRSRAPVRPGTAVTIVGEAASGSRGSSASPAMALDSGDGDDGALWLEGRCFESTTSTSYARSWISARSSFATRTARSGDPRGRPRAAPQRPLDPGPRASAFGELPPLRSRGGHSWRSPST
jgi:hypothetical protein